jgi:hypothetical protein
MFERSLTMTIDLRAVLNSCIDNVDMLIVIDEDYERIDNHTIAIYVEHCSDSSVFHRKLVRVIDGPITDFSVLQDVIGGIKKAAADVLAHVLREPPTFKTCKCPNCGKTVYGDEN